MSAAAAAAVKNRAGVQVRPRRCLPLVIMTATTLASCPAGPTGAALHAEETASAVDAAGAASVPANLDVAISRGLAFLAGQQAADGSFNGDAPKVATASLSLLAMLAAGQTSDAGRYGLAVRRTADFLLAHQADDGYFGAGDRGMYAHAMATLALAEDYGVEAGRDRRIQVRGALARAVGVILAAQNAAKSSPAYAGGWRYERNSPDSDLSLSGWNVLALRAARDAGIDVPDDAMHRAADFVLHCYNDADKGFTYQPGGGAQPGETGIGMLCLYALEASERAEPQLAGAAGFLNDHPMDEKTPFFYYAGYYITQATFQRGGATWSKVGRATLERLIRLQDAGDGGWPQSSAAQEPGRVYATAMALQALAVPYRLLPVYQR